MSFGDTVGFLKNGGTSTTNPVHCTTLFSGSNAAKEGDLLYAVFLVAVVLLQGTPPTDNLGNTWAPCNAGNDAGTMSARAYYSIATNPGTLTDVSIPATASSNDWCIGVAIVEGPFNSIDRNPANTINDIASPFLCPFTGTMAQADELVMSWFACDGIGGSVAAVSPSVMIGQAVATGLTSYTASRVVTATTSIQPSFTSPVAPTTNSVLGTTSFKLDPRQPHAKRMGGVRHAQRVRRGGGVTMWREAASGLLVPRWV